MNPIKFQIECETAQEYCDHHNFTEAFLLGVIWWAFPPHGVIPVPLDLGYRQRIVWDDKYPESAPFELECAFSGQIPWTHKQVWTNKYRFAIIYARTDVYPLIWVYWWFYFRLKETLKITMRWFILVLEVWGLAEIQPGEIASWQNIKIFKNLRH